MACRVAVSGTDSEEIAVNIVDVGRFVHKETWCGEEASVLHLNQMEVLCAKVEAHTVYIQACDVDDVDVYPELVARSICWIVENERRVEL